MRRREAPGHARMSLAGDFEMLALGRRKVVVESMTFLKFLILK